MYKAAIAPALFLALAAAGRAVEPVPPRHLLVQVRDTAPRGPASLHHGADGSFTVSTLSGASREDRGAEAVSTGSGAPRDDRGAQEPDNGTLVSTSNSVRRVHILEGERVRVDLPAVQSLQFHAGVPPTSSPASPAASPASTVSPAAARSAAAPSASGNSGTAPSVSGNSGTAPSVSGVVYFEAVAAFAARFFLAGRSVQIELTPLHRGGVAAPYGAAGSPADHPVTVTGRVGEWIALGDTDLYQSGKSLNATAEPTTPASVWVRVDPEAPGPP